MVFLPGAGVVQVYSMIRKILASPWTVYILIGVAAAFHVLTIRAGYKWEGDSALYMAHARNIATGHPYADTGYLFNPHVPLLSPRVYPPVFPLLLAPVYHFFGLNLFAMKTAGVVVFALFLLVLYRYTRKRLSAPELQLAVVAAVAFSPWVWVAKDLILSDLYFIFFAYAAILVLDRADMRDKLDRRQLLFALLSALIIYLAYGTRSLGLLLVPALVMSDVLRHRTLRGFTVVVTVLFVVFYMAQNAALDTDQSYLDSYKGSVLQRVSPGEVGRVAGVEGSDLQGFEVKQVLLDLGGRVLENLEYYHQVMSSYWITHLNDGLDDGIYLVMGLLAIAGFISLVMRRPSLGDYFLVLNVAVLLVVPFLQNRYMLPLVPLYLIYVFQGVEVVASRVGRVAGHTAEFRSLLLGGVAATVILVYAGTYAASDFGAYREGVEKAESVELFSFIRQNTPEDSVIVFRNPRPLALFTGRKSSMYFWTETPNELWDYLTGIGATHIVEHKESAGLQGSAYLHEWLDPYLEELELLFENNDFRVYQFPPGPRDPGTGARSG